VVADECHKITAKWERPVSEVTPPKSSTTAVWTVAGFGSGKGSGGANAPIHFGDTTSRAETSDEEVAAGNGSKAPAKQAAKSGAKNPAKAAAASASRKARR
jgi:hypothetical protein